MVGPDGQPVMVDGNQMAYTQEQIDVSFKILAVSSQDLVSSANQAKESPFAF